jgi:hypothetical protein
MPDKEIYCGVNPLKKKQRLGSMKECAEKKQIRLYGKYKVDDRIIKLATGKNKSLDKSREELLVKMVSFRAIIKRLSRELDAGRAKGKDIDKEKHKKLIDSTKIKLKAVVEQIKEVEKKMKQKGGSKRSSRKASRKASRKSSKRPSKK